MKQTNLTILFEEVKLTALKRYMAKKDVGLEEELVSALNKLYEKFVPAQVREYIEDMESPLPDAPRPRRSGKPAAVQEDESMREETQDGQS